MKGDFSNDISYDFGLSYSSFESVRTTNDSYTVGASNALLGFGVCSDPITGAIPTGAAPGVGDCEYYNPFSNAVQANAITGQANPQYDASLANSVALADWLTDPNTLTNETSLLVFDAVFSGQSALTAPGGNVGWAAGLQIRNEQFDSIPNDLGDCAQNPGASGSGVFSFLACQDARSEEQTIFALFTEFQIPLYDDLDIQVAMRYENYGDEVGSTFDPKLAAKYTVNDYLSLRGSAQTSFKGPSLNQLGGKATTLQFIAPTGAFKAVDQVGNANLKPESALSFNFGALFENGGLSASLDYYNFDISDPIAIESQNDIVNNLITDNIVFDGVGTGAANITRVLTNIINGPDIKTSGIDARIDYEFEPLSNGALFSVGGESTYALEYEIGDYEISGVTITGGDIVGQFNRSNPFRSMPQWKANAYANLELGDHNIRAVVRHISDYDDERPASARGGVAATIDAQTTFDLHYNWFMPYDIDLSLSVVNVTDEDPPLAAFDLNYDPYTHDPLGRTIKVGLKKTF